jgi:energy-coupling factor transporter ATP-binding protein EcfA2
MPSWDWNGARWWKFDLHTHTPASIDYGKGSQQAALHGRTPKEWLLDYMRAGIDCVAITDHNTGAWIDNLREALRELDAERPTGYRPIHIFAGVEISANGGVHLLAILASDKTTSDVDSLLGAAGFSGTKGSSDDVTSRSFREVVSEITRAGGIAIPAHADGYNGLFRLQGSTLRQAIDTEGMFAMEVVDPTAAKPTLLAQKAPRWAEVLGSDAHHPSGAPGQRYPGSHFTWVKMGSPSIEGLRLALLDGPLSILRSDQAERDPNEHAPLVLEAVEVTSARYMGRARPFMLTLNPWLNAIVGGRGTGKSTLVEFMRLALRREGELPDDLKPEFEKYGRPYSSREDSGLLTAETAIRVLYRKNGSRFRIQWNPAGNLDPIEEETSGGWRRAEGDVSQRFPIRMYSQKQVFHLAKTPLALLRIVDEAPAVDRRSWESRWKEEEGRFLSLRAKARELEAGLLDEPRLRGELDDVKRKLAVFEAAGHADVLKEFQKRSRQQRAVEAWEESWANTGQRLRELAADVVPDPLDPTTLDPNASEDADLRNRAALVCKQMGDVRREILGLAEKTDQISRGWASAREASAWNERVRAALQGYEDLRKRLAAEGAGDPAAYGELVQRQQALERRLAELGGRRKQVEDLRKQAEASLARLQDIRRGLTESRRAFLAEVLKDNRYVRIQISPYGARDTVEAELRRLLQREGGGFEKDIGSPSGGGLLGKLYAAGNDPTAIEKALAGVKEDLHAIAGGRYDTATLGDRRFASHLGKLPPESLDRIDLWFPEDSLEVQYSTTGDGQHFRSIQEGSPGQKTAALLAFLLSYGEEPLVLDQPEDDLDNHLIYDLIVTQLREVKRRRQIIVVTHNANIVVNGDAELVVALAARAGETQKECEGSLQERQVRDTICEVMEGGREAFAQRYRRIALEGRHV